jgi:gamma-glutamyl-gamma-aminobutyraldehyde dehydrogenase
MISNKGVAQDAAARRKEVVFDIRPYIDGRYVSSRSTGAFEKYNPADGTLLTSFPSGSAADVDLAVKSARTSFEDGRWSKRPQADRKATLLRFADLLERDRESLALIEAVEVGKLLRDARTIDLPMAAAILRYTATAADHLFGSTYPTDSRSLALTIRAARGVAAAIVAWNFPIVLAIQKVAPALITGNSVVLKPSELTSQGALRLGELALEAGVPEGVFNIVPGLGTTVGSALANHMDVNILAFTGSTTTGKRLLQAAGSSNMKRLVLECGGKSAHIVFEDAPDLDLVADGVFARMFANQGQVCSAGTRLIVHRGLHDALLAKLKLRIDALVPGDPLHPETTFGPLVSAAQRDKVQAYVESGLESEARLFCGNEHIVRATGGFFVAPTVFRDVDPDAKIAQEEIFGPVLCVHAFDHVDEAIFLANRSTYGLTATAWTTNLATAHRLVREVKAGEITIRGTGKPSSGAALGTLPIEPHQQSGFGIEGGLEGIAAYTTLTAAQIFV